MNTKVAKAHVALLAAGVMWGLMSPIGKSAMDAGFSSFSLAFFRMTGATLCFWLASLFVPKEKVAPRDYRLLLLAALLSIVFNQGVFLLGLSLTSPIDASIITTLAPIITLILAALFLKEAITSMKLAGVLLGAFGAAFLILSGQSGDGKSNILGNLLCLSSQLSFAIYLTKFKDLISRYSVFTIMKWMFTYATICFVPISYSFVMETFTETYTLQVWLKVAYVIFFGTFLTYMLMVVGQKKLSPTVVSIYSYVQPVVSIIASVIIGVGSFGINKLFACILVFTGVYLVTSNKK